MTQSIGKKFEEAVRSAFERNPSTTLIRLPDPVQGYLGYRNICDFIVYHYPNQFFIECKTVQGNLLPFSNITDNQWKGMLEMSKCPGVIAGVICWWRDKDVTKFIPIQLLQQMKWDGKKSISYSLDKYYHGEEPDDYPIITLQGRKKRVFFDYRMEEFFNEVQSN